MKAQTVWQKMSRILSREGARPRVSRFFFKDAVQSVLIFSAETWMFTTCTVRALGGFQDQVERRLMGRLTWRRMYGRWEYTLVEAEIAEAGFGTVETYIRRR